MKKRKNNFLDRKVTYTTAIIMWAISLVIGLLLRYFLKGY